MDAQMLAQYLQKGIAAAKAKDKETARHLLTAVVDADETVQPAWLWLAYVVDDLDDKTICFENILSLDPNNETALKGLDWIATQRRSKMLQEALAKDVGLIADLPPEPAKPQEIEAVDAPNVDEFDNEWLCVYCAAPTTQQDISCPNCRKPLVIRARVSQERTVWLWRGIFLQLYTAFYLLVAAIGYYAVTGWFNDIGRFADILPSYWGATSEHIPQAQIDLMHTLFPPWLFWVVVGVSLYVLLVTLLLYVRVPYGHLFYMFNAGLTLLVGLMGVVILPGFFKIGGFIALLLSFLQVYIITHLWHDFDFHETRLKCKVDPNIKTGEALYLQGQDHAAVGQWGLATCYWRRAKGRSSANLTINIALIKAYLNLNRFDLAQTGLDDTLSRYPDNPQLLRLQNMLATRTGGETV